MLAQQHHSTAENWISYNSFRYNYRITRSPTPKMPPMLFLCGAFQNASSWRKFETYFSTIADIIVVELPGNGKADILPATYGIEYYRQALRKLLDEINVDKVYMVAASYGTPIAYDFAQHYPDSIERLVLCGTMKKIPEHMKSKIEHSLESLERGDLNEFMQLAVDNLTSKTLLKKSIRFGLGARVLKSQLLKYSRDDQVKYRENTKRLLEMEPLNLSSPPKVKTLVFTGEYDEFTRPEHCEEIAKAIPDAQFATIKNADHLFHFQQLETVIELLEKFGKEKSIHNVAGCNYKYLN